MNIDYMREFVHLAETLNFTKTARDFFITQPTLSKHLANIEKELDAPMMSRSTHEVRLTKAGKVAYQDFKKILSLYTKTLQDVEGVKEGLDGSIRLGFIYYGGMTYMRRGLSAYHAEYPKVHIEFLSYQPYQIIHGLQKDDLDAGLVMKTEALSDEDFQFVPVHECKLYAFVGENSTYAHQQSITVEQLFAKPALLFRSDPFYNKAICYALEQQGLSFNPSIPCEQIDLFPDTLNDCDCIMVGTGHLPHGEDDHVVRLPISDAHPTMSVGIYAKRSSDNYALPGFLRQWSA